MCVWVYLSVCTHICLYGINNPLVLSGTLSDPSVSPQKTNFTGDVQFFTGTHGTNPHTEGEKGQKTNKHRIEEDKERGGNDEEMEQGRKGNMEEN